MIHFVFDQEKWDNLVTYPNSSNTFKSHERKIMNMKQAFLPIQKENVTYTQRMITIPLKFVLQKNLALFQSLSDHNQPYNIVIMIFWLLIFFISNCRILWIFFSPYE